jgi:hypothetical protein
MTYVDTWEHRGQFRGRLLREVRRLAEEDILTIDAPGIYEGLEVVTLKNLNERLNVLELEELPPASGMAAEIRTPGFVTLWAKCPRCGESAPIRVSLESELRVDSHAGTLHAKAKAKPASHVCGQTLLPVGDEDQEDFGLDDVVGEVPELADLQAILHEADLLETTGYPDDEAGAEKRNAAELELLGTWTDLDRREAFAYAEKVIEKAIDESVVLPPMPEVLGGPDGVEIDVTIETEVTIEENEEEPS